MQGTGFLVDAKNELIATAFHVIGNDTSNLVVLMPREGGIENYQELSDVSCQMVNAVLVEIDPINDIAIIKTDLRFDDGIPALGSFDGK